jgi:glycogen synthase kinase 3 beta
VTSIFKILELSIRDDLISQLVPPHAEEEILSRGIDIHNFTPLTQSQMRASLD